MLIAEIYHFTLTRPLVLIVAALLCVFLKLYIGFIYFPRNVQQQGRIWRIAEDFYCFVKNALTGSMIGHFYLSCCLWLNRSLTITDSYTSATGFDILQYEIIITYIIYVKTGFFRYPQLQMSKVNLRHSNDRFGFHFAFRIFCPLTSYYLNIRFAHAFTIYWISYKAIVR